MCKGITRARAVAAALIVAGLMGASVACSSSRENRGPGAATSDGPPLAPVHAPLAPARAGTRFAPASPLPLASPGAVRDAKETAAGENEEALPPRSVGTHVTAALARKDGSRLVAVWGDPVLWERRRGGAWRPAPGLPRLTGKAAEVIGLAEDPKTGRITIGTRREGGFVARAGETTWRALPLPNAPYDANAQALASYRGVLFVATLGDGLVVRDRDGVWGHIAPPVISGDAPRQFVVWRDALYVRHGDGRVDRFDGRVWTRDVFTRRVPRRQVSAMATDGDTLFLAQWGGWSETRDSRTFTPRFPADLSGLPITALLPTQNRVFVGTQGRGLAECDRETGALRVWHDERGGIGDDWITALALSPAGRLVAGTFVNGAFWSETSPPNADGSVCGPWRPLPETQNDCVTAIAAPPSGAVFVALRRGGVRRYESDESEDSGKVTPPLPEAQCLLADAGNGLLWVGARTGLQTIAARSVPPKIETTPPASPNQNGKRR